MEIESTVIAHSVGWNRFGSFLEICFLELEKSNSTSMKFEKYIERVRAGPLYPLTTLLRCLALDVKSGTDYRGF
jgi:hypothetical protein